ncbi:TIGR03750 family conjugal transfer protein [Shinella sp.]|uniref:TIGR03750 family conjugal transfer protein n=1 Tax=Shinella sp. TaxID=1870904 RepID=UPI00258B30ED|nr:TIGR03750 family conjugal transfer protein [Shinella sp.]MCW5706949.1 TIGR03750 family conjugal transfer protein [Shinella sp.]
MTEHPDMRPDGTVAFLPHRLNRHPVVVRGLTADELWVCAGLSGAAGFVAGLPASIVFASVAIAPTAIIFAIAIGVFIGGGVLRRKKRGRPDVWLYRQLQWRVARHYPLLARLLGIEGLILRSGWWTTRRTQR